MLIEQSARWYMRGDSGDDKHSAGLSDLLAEITRASRPTARTPSVGPWVQSSQNHNTT